MLRYADRCSFIVDRQKDESFKNDQWYKEFINLYREIKDYDYNREKNEDYNNLFKEIRGRYANIFDKIDNEFNRSSPINFIKFILRNHPYNDFENDKKRRGEKFFTNYNLALVNYLLEKYEQGNIPHNRNEETKLKYCIAHEIFNKLNNLYTRIQ